MVFCWDLGSVFLLLWLVLLNFLCVLFFGWMFLCNFVWMWCLWWMVGCCCGLVGSGWVWCVLVLVYWFGWVLLVSLCVIVVFVCWLFRYECLWWLGCYWLWFVWKEFIWMCDWVLGCWVWWCVVVCCWCVVYCCWVVVVWLLKLVCCFLGLGFSRWVCCFCWFWLWWWFVVLWWFLYLGMLCEWFLVWSNSWGCCGLYRWFWVFCCLFWFGLLVFECCCVGIGCWLGLFWFCLKWFWMKLGRLYVCLDCRYWWLVG